MGIKKILLLIILLYNNELTHSVLRDKLAVRFVYNFANIKAENLKKKMFCELIHFRSLNKK